MLCAESNHQTSERDNSAKRRLLLLYIFYFIQKVDESFEPTIQGFIRYFTKVYALEGQLNFETLFLKASTQPPGDQTK